MKINSHEKLSVLIIGCGNIAGGFDTNSSSNANPFTHAGAFSQHGGFNLIACIDPDAHKLAIFKSRWNVNESFPSLECIKHRIGDFDIISICSPTHLHSAHLEASLRLKPRLVFCEKPVTPTLLESTKWINKFNNAGILFAVNYTRRWDPRIQNLQHELTTKKWGGIRSIAGYYNKGILNNGGHLIDLIHNLIGPVKVEWTGKPIWDFWKNDPSIPAILHSNKEEMYISFNIGDARDYSYFELQIIMENGIVIMEDGGMNWRMRYAVDSKQFAGYKTLSKSENIKGEYGLAMRNAISNIYESVVSNALLLSTGETSIQTQEVCDQISDDSYKYN